MQSLQSLANHAERAWTLQVCFTKWIARYSQNIKDCWKNAQTYQKVLEIKRNISNDGIASMICVFKCELLFYFIIFCLEAAAAGSFFFVQCVCLRRVKTCLGVNRIFVRGCRKTSEIFTLLSIDQWYIYVFFFGGGVDWCYISIP